MKRRNGYTLVEVLISMVLTALMVGAVFSIAITSQTSGNKVDRHVLVNQYSRHLSETLGEYVADSNSISANNLQIAGPTNTTAGTASWSLTGITGEDGRPVSDACPGGGTTCWALASGTHTITGFLPLWFEAPAGVYKATLTYYVNPTAGLAYGGAPAANQANLANVTINWTEP